VARLRSTLLLLTAGSVVLGCTASLSDGGGGTPDPTTNRYTQLTLSLEDEAELSLPNLTVLTPGLPPSYPAPANCPALSNLADGDGDGIFDDATFSYTNPPCVVSGFNGGTLTVTGTVRLQDSTASDAFSYRLTMTNLAWQFTDATGSLSYTATRNGTRSRSVDSTGVTLVVHDTTKRQLPQITAIATIAKSLTWTFLPSPGSTVTVNQPLPDGTVTVAGTWHWTRSTENYDLTVETPTPLVYDATCTTTPQRIKSGQVTMSGTIGGVNGVLLIQWSACGTAPTRSFTPTP
jgi:hypothetical protein